MWAAMRTLLLIALVSGAAMAGGSVQSTAPMIGSSTAGVPERAYPGGPGHPEAIRTLYA